MERSGVQPADELHGNCRLVHDCPARSDAKINSVALAQPWSANADDQNAFGIFDPKERWRGWVTGTDADTGQVRWRYKTPAPVLAAVTPTAGELVFTADMAANAYAFDAETGKMLWRSPLEGAAGGGVITYSVNGAQRVAFAVGTNSPIWPVDKKSAKIVVFGLR